MSNPAHLLIGERLNRFFGCKKAGAAGCLWRCIHEFALILWVVRAPVGVVAFGYLLLGATPQAQDLLVPLVNASPWRVLWFFVLLFVFWAMPVHYSARILICDDARLYAYKQENSSPYLDWLERWIPRLLGAVTFLALVMSAYRANSNLPILRPQDQGVIDEISRNLYYFMLWSVLGLILFLLYTVSRTDLGQLAGRRWTDRAAALFRPLLNLLDFGKTNSARQLGADVFSNEFGKLVLIFVFAVFVIVLGYEKVRVPAGEFDAFKLEARCKWVSPQAPFPGACDDMYWYAPAVRAIVKKVAQGTGMPIYTTELVEFQLQP